MVRFSYMHAPLHLGPDFEPYSNLRRLLAVFALFSLVNYQLVSRSVCCIHGVTSLLLIFFPQKLPLCSTAPSGPTPSCSVPRKAGFLRKSYRARFLRPTSSSWENPSYWDSLSETREEQGPAALSDLLALQARRQVGVLSLLVWNLRPVHLLGRRLGLMALVCSPEWVSVL